MNRTGRAIVLGGFVMLVLGADWALERAFNNYHPKDRAGVSESATPNDSVASALACEPWDMPAASQDRTSERG